jgi:hypothetical protein
MISQRLQVVSAAVLATLLLSNARPGTSNSPGATKSPRSAFQPRPECPVGGEWSAVFLALRQQGITTGGPNGQLALSGPITDVPEFHDCQQLIVLDNGNARFTSLFAVFARFRLDSNEVTNALNIPGRIVPVAEVFAFDSAYSPLGVQRKFNCLYLSRTQPGQPGKFTARMVPVGNSDTTCLKPPRSGSGTPLDVRPVPMPTARSADYPPVARWDWDRTNRLQFIGVRCGAMWCEVGQKLSDSQPTSPEYPPRPGVVEERRVLQIKGWYDEQRLALPSKTGGRPTVGMSSATFIPDPHLDRDIRQSPGQSRFRNSWVAVASVAIDGPAGPYESKLNLKASSMPNAANKVELCFNATTTTPNRCLATGPAPARPCAPGTEWWARITPPSGNARVFCVVRRDHSALPTKIPGIVRWRWALNDETMWIRCLQGCCEVESDQ